MTVAAQTKVQVSFSGYYLGSRIERTKELGSFAIRTNFQISIGPVFSTQKKDVPGKWKNIKDPSK